MHTYIYTHNYITHTRIHIYIYLHIHIHTHTHAIDTAASSFCPPISARKTCFPPYLNSPNSFGCLHYGVFLAWPDSVEHRHADRHIVCQRWSSFCFILPWFFHCGRGGRTGKRPELQSGSCKIWCGKWPTHPTKFVGPHRF